MLVTAAKYLANLEFIGQKRQFLRCEMSTISHINSKLGTTHGFEQAARMADEH